MNRSALKTYAPKARLGFIQAVTDRAGVFGLTPDRTEAMQETGDVVLIGGRAFPKGVASQRRSLEGRIQRQGFGRVMEALAYTWFNRFVALRYMELHGYLEHGYRVLSHPEAKPTPEILEHAEHVTLPGLKAAQVINLKLDGSREAELYRLLLVAQCNALHEAMPFLFEKIADETELLLPDNLLHSDSLIRKLVTELHEADWQQVEIIGWLYQFYISDKKDEVIGKVVKSEDIPAATQLFTPNWIVKYLVQNTLGRQWLATYPDSPLRQQMEYYIEPAAQTDDVQAQLAAITPQSLDPETLTLLDPASGSGHILVEAYDLFKAIYQERGYRSKDIPRLILEKNLFGLEIDDRAAQLAAFALLMKARADDRRIFADHVQPNVIAIQESKGLENLLRPDPAAAKGVGELPFADNDLFPQTEKQLTLTKPNQESPLAAVEPCLRELINLFEHGKTFGSLIRVPPELAAQLRAARQSIEAMITTGQLWENRAATLLMPLLKQAELLAKTYDAVVTNPPYMGAKYYNDRLKSFVNEQYGDGKADLYAAFIIRDSQLASPHGSIGMITIPNWMFLSSFEELRNAILDDHCVESFSHNGRGVWGSDFGSCAFVLRKTRCPSHAGVFKRLFDKQGSVAAPEELEQRFFNVEPCSIAGKEFKKIPGSPIAFWVSDAVRDLFVRHESLVKIVQPLVGLQTSDNERFIRFWPEISLGKICFTAKDRHEALQSKAKWFPLNKGGGFRKWFGLNEFVVNWEDDGKEIKDFIVQSHPGSTYTKRVMSESLYFKENVTWGLISVAQPSFRYNPPGFIFNVSGPSIFPTSDILYFCAFLNSSPVRYLLEVLSPSVSFTPGMIGKLPFPSPGSEKVSVIELARECVQIAEADWDSLETSWSFSKSPLLREPVMQDTLAHSQSSWGCRCDSALDRLGKTESQLNQTFVQRLGLNGEVSAEVASESLGLIRADREQDMQRLISYAIGCAMGRYSLDKPGLVYAHNRNEGFDASQYQTFPADADGIIPITELAWFPDDATERFVEFIGKAWPAAHLEENLTFIADSLGANRDEHPRDTIRRYLSQNFYKDHLQIYKRRPIYWLFSSGKQKAFQCLVYLHRYHEGTLARMRTEYVIPLQGKLSQRIEQLAGDITAATSTSHRRKLEKERDTLIKQRAELAAFDEKLRHYADQRIALDLDDGVKVNYGKFGDLLAEVKVVTGGAEE